MKNRKIPMRKCCGCFEIKPQNEMLRIVKDKEGNISLDLTGKKNGRGAYVCKSQDCIDTAYKMRRLEKAFSCKVSNEVYEEIKNEFSKENN